jgi:hypothetical protein
MARQVSLINYLPNVLKDYEELTAIMSTDSTEVNTLWIDLENVTNDQFCDTLTTNGCKRWESILNITAKDTDTLDDRRFRIKSRLNEQLPYTHKVLEQQLITLCGPDGYSLEIDNNAYRIKVRVDLLVKAQFNAVSELLGRMRPCNMVVDLDLLYNQHLTLANFTYGHLAGYTQQQLRDEVIS